MAIGDDGWKNPTVGEEAPFDGSYCRNCDDRNVRKVVYASKSLGENPMVINGREYTHSELDPSCQFAHILGQEVNSWATDTDGITIFSSVKALLDSNDCTLPNMLTHASMLIQILTDALGDLPEEAYEGYKGMVMSIRARHSEADIAGGLNYLVTRIREININLNEIQSEDES